MEHKYRVRSEATEQEAVIRWCRNHTGQFPELDLIFHIPNGGSRNKLEAARLKMQGVRAGVCDLFLPVPRGIYHGLFIEMKYGTGRPSQAQKDFISAVTKQGYMAMCAWGVEEAVRLLTSYLEDGCGTAEI